MANPQLENGYTKIANEIIERLVKESLSGRCFRILLAIFRETYGWHRKKVKISLVKLGKIINCASRHLISCLKELEMKNILKIERSVKGNLYSFQKDYDIWEEKFKPTNTENSSPIFGSPENGSPVFGSPENGTTGSPENGTTGSPENGTTEHLTAPVATQISDTPKDKLKIIKESKIDRPKKTGRSGSKKTIYLVDEIFLSELEKNSAYSEIDIRKEYGKMQAWLLTPRGRGKQPTQNRFLYWLNNTKPENFFRNEAKLDTGLIEVNGKRYFKGTGGQLGEIK